MKKKLHSKCEGDLRSYVAVVGGENSIQRRFDLASRKVAGVPLPHNSKLATFHLVAELRRAERSRSIAHGCEEQVEASLFTFHFLFPTSRSAKEIGSIYNVELSGQ